MNFVLLFNNSIFQNSNLINTLKRFLIYQINKCIKNNIYNKIIIIRTYQTINIYEYDLIFENLEKIIITINNIIFKNYNDIFINYNNLIDLLMNYYKLNSEIIIINSSSNHLLFEDIYYKFKENKELLLKDDNHNVYQNLLSSPEISKELLKRRMIIIIDISKYNFTINYDLFLQFFIDSRSLHIKDIICANLINYFKDKDDIINIPNIDDLSRYLDLFEKCDFDCINGKIIEKSVIDSIENIKITNNIEGGDNYINLLINSIIKNIKRNQYQSIKIPIDNIDKEIYNTNIKYILEFYSIIYPKILNNYLNSNYKNNISTNYKKNYKINELVIKKNNKTEMLEEDESLNYTISNISMTNWIDEYNEYNPYGILIKYNISRHSYKGLIDEKSSIIKTFPNMIVDSISNNWISLYDYYQLIISYKNEDVNEKIDEVDKFNLNDFKINDSIHGETNIMLPMYINKNHWNLTKSLWRYHLSFINNSFESEYNRKMDNIYYLTLLKNFTNLLDKTITDNKIILFIHILRTSIQVSIDNKYINTINSEYSRYLNYLINLEDKEEKNLIEINLIDYIIRYLQYSVSYCDIINLEKDLDKIRIKLLDTWVNKVYSNNIMYKEYYNNLEEADKNKELEKIKNNFISEYINWFNLEITLMKFSKVLNLIYKMKGFNQFIKFVDKTNCYLDNNYHQENEITCINIKNIISSCNNFYDLYLEDLKLKIKIEKI
jgi:hypothetical protein